MIHVDIGITKDGLLCCFEASGHAGYSEKGSDIVCSAFSSFVRTMAKLCEGRPSVTVRGGASEPGEIVFEIMNVSDEDMLWFKGITDFLLHGLGDLEQDYPKHIKLNINVIGRIKDGT